jgi:hypothetical protein
MEIAALNATGVATDPAAFVRSSGAAASVAPTPAQAQAPDTPVAPAAISGRAGLTAWDPQLQGQLADAQQALQFLDAAASQLQGLKADLSGKLAGRAVPDGDISARLKEFAATWKQRSRSTGGSLGPQLDFSSPAPAAQRFTVRGLNLRSLQSGDTESLSLSVGGAGRAAMTVRIDAGLTADQIVQRFNQALAPANITVAADDSGALVFSVAESAWPSVRDTLTIRGGGQRFPSGQPVRVKTDAEPAAVQPDTWHAGDAESLRQALRQVVQALDGVQQARRSVSQALATATAAASQSAAAASADAAGAQAPTFAEEFAAAISQPGFAAFTPVTAALTGISRDRVLSLLALSQG